MELVQDHGVDLSRRENPEKSMDCPRPTFSPSNKVSQTRWIKKQRSHETREDSVRLRVQPGAVVYELKRTAPFSNHINGPNIGRRHLTGDVS